MPNCDLVVTGVRFQPTPVRAPCPLGVVVRIRNDGAALPAFNNPGHIFEVCLASPAFVAEGGDTYRQPVTVKEGELRPGTWIDVTFQNVRFDRGGRGLPVTATADCALPGGPAATNDARTQAHGLTVGVDVQAVAWLWTDGVVFGLTDSHGNNTVPVTTLCPGESFWVQATITNRGLATAVPSTAELALTDAAGNVLQTVATPVPAINPGFAAVATFSPSAPAPVPAAGTTQTVTAQVCADVAGAVAPQCNRLHLCAPSPATATVASTAAAPRLTFGSGGIIVFPGQPYMVDWSIRNSCADLGQVTATISFEGVQLYKSAPIAVGLQTTAGEQGVAVTAAGQRQPLPSDFWKVNPATPQQLHLEVTGTGKDPGPYTADLTMTVTSEQIMQDQWQWDPAPTSADNPGSMDWNTSYAVSGTFTNSVQGSETMSATLDFSEVDGSASPPAPTGQTFSTTLSNMNPGAVLPAMWSGLKQTWQWLLPVAWVIDGPTLKPMLYQVSFTLQDEYGNAYGPVTGAQLVVDVSVPSRKIALAAAALTAELEAGLMLACAAAQYAGAVFTFGATAVSATVFVGIAAGLEATATATGAAAEDPPVPDFRYAEAVPVTIPPLGGAVARAPEALAPLRALLELLNRCMAAVAALDPIEGRWWGARIDGDLDAASRQAEAYAAAAGLLSRAGDALVQTAGDIALTLRDLTAPHTGQILDALARIRRGDLPPELVTEWRAANLDEQVLARLRTACAHLGPTLPDPSGAMASLCEALQRVAAAARQRAAEMAAAK